MLSKPGFVKGEAPRFASVLVVIGSDEGTGDTSSIVKDLFVLEAKLSIAGEAP
jgi:hypothetical protein